MTVLFQNEQINTKKAASLLLAALATIFYKRRCERQQHDPKDPHYFGMIHPKQVLQVLNMQQISHEEHTLLMHLQGNDLQKYCDKNTLLLNPVYL